MHLPIWICVVVGAGLLAFTLLQMRQTVASVREENGQLRQRLSELDQTEAKNLELTGQREELVRLQASALDKMQRLQAEVERLRKESNELAEAYGALHQTSSNRLHAQARLEGENRSLREQLGEVAGRPRVPRIGAWLGAFISNAATAESQPNLPLGAVVNQVVERSPAQRAKLQEGDVIVGLDGHAVESAEAFKNLMIQKVGGQDLTLEIIRTNALIRVNVTPVDWAQ